MPKPLRYHRLGTNGEAIRLLELQPATCLDGSLQCTLRHVRMHEFSFSALSYVWGDPTVVGSVLQINYKTNSIKSAFRSKRKFEYGLPIGRNLTNALTHIRHRENVVTLWVDAICIDQKSDAEKSSQLPFMKKIYSTARNVIAWLGPSLGEEPETPNRIKAAFELANSLWTLSEKLTYSQANVLEKDWLESCFHIAEGASTSSPRFPIAFESSEHDRSAEPANTRYAGQRTQELARGQQTTLATSLLEALGTNNDLKRSIVNLIELSRLQWWSRVWILQEAGRASDMVFRYGDQEIPQRPVLLAMSLGNRIRGSFPDYEMQMALQKFDTRFLNCMAARITCREGKSIKDVLELAYWDTPPLHAATDPRDHIYARLGLADHQEELKANYELPVSEVYIETAKFLLSKGFMAPLLTFRPYRFMQAVPTIELPSWSYDWRKKGHDAFVNTKFDASKGSSQLLEFSDLKGAYCQRTVKVSGVDVGFIKDAGKKFHSLVSEAELSQEVIARRTLRKELNAQTLDIKQDIITRITRTSQSFNISISAADLGPLFEEQAIPLASFWCWWLSWISEISRLSQSAQTQGSSRSHTNDLVELLFREAPSGVFGRGISLPALADWRRWSRLVFRDSANQSGTQRTRMTPDGIELVDSLFRSAWGMRPVSLDTGHLGCVPEDAKPQDRVVILHGVNAPLVIRKVVKDTYCIIGPAHICGVMQGQLMDAGLPSCAYTFV